VIEVAPRRDEHTTRWLWQAGIANDLKESYGQSASRRIASYDDVSVLDRTMGGSFRRLDEKKVFRKRTRQNEIILCKKGDTGTNRTQEGLVERKGTDTGEQADSWALQTANEAPQSMPVRQSHHFT
jgi:hypothetical protein